MRERCLASGGKTVSTTGCMKFQPNAINVIPSRAVFTVDVRNPNEAFSIHSWLKKERWLKNLTGMESAARG